jgi:hypothetical protein
MSRRRFPDLIPLLPVRRAPTAAAFTLIFALVAGLACDETAPTETRAPAGSPELGPGEEPSLAVGDITAMGTIELPINQTVATTPPNPAFRIGQTGTGPNGIFQISNSSNNRPAVQGLTNGVGRAGYFQNTNASNTQAVVDAQTNGRGAALQALSTGAGRAALFQATSATNTENALSVITAGRGAAGFFQSVGGPAVLGATSGGAAGHFESSSAASSQPTLRVHMNGTERAGVFEITNANSTADVLEVRTLGRGVAGRFHIPNAASAAPALEVQTSGTGPAGSFRSSHTGNTESALMAHSSASGGGSAVAGFQIGTNGRAGFFDISNPSNPEPALLARTVSPGFAARFLGNGPNSLGVEIGVANLPNGLALGVQGRSFFRGNVHVEGTLTKRSGSFRIDHPLDPENKYLSHSFVESPDMMNVYNGNAMLDGRGEAVIMLPTYFEALNSDFRYQLTAIGAPGPNLHVSQEIRNNRFVIAGGVPGTKVSWQVTGIRQDAYANEHPIKVEEDKPAKEQKRG